MLSKSGYWRFRLLWRNGSHHYWGWAQRSTLCRVSSVASCVSCRQCVGGHIWGQPAGHFRNACDVKKKEAKKAPGPSELPLIHVRQKREQYPVTSRLWCHLPVSCRNHRLPPWHFFICMLWDLSVKRITMQWIHGVCVFVINLTMWWLGNCSNVTTPVRVDLPVSGNSIYGSRQRTLSVNYQGSRVSDWFLSASFKENGPFSLPRRREYHTRS